MKTPKKPYDATTRNLFESGPVEWLRFLRRQVPDPELVSMVDSNISSFTAEADRVIRIGGPRPWIELIEAQAGRDKQLERRSHLYSTVLEWKHEIPVRCSLLLLRPAADGPELTGRLELRDADGTVYDTFLYNVIRWWEQPVESVLEAGLAVLPLAPVARVTPEELPDVLVAMSDRLRQQAPLAQAAEFWGATRIMMGLRYPKEQIDAVIRGVHGMLYGIRGLEEASSVIVDAVQRGEAKGIAKGEAIGIAKGEAIGIAKGEARGVRRSLIHLGTRKFGPPDRRIRSRISRINDIDRLDALIDRILNVATWSDLLANDSQ